MGRASIALLLLHASLAVRAFRTPAGVTCARTYRKGVAACSTARSGATVLEATNHLVWLTGCADLRLRDHDGFAAAAEAAGTEEGSAVVPVFALETAMHLANAGPTEVARLHAALVGLNDEVRFSSPRRFVPHEPIAHSESECLSTASLRHVHRGCS